MHHHQTLLPLQLHRQGGPAPGGQILVTGLRRALKILWVQIAAPLNDEVFEATGHEKFPTL